MLLTISFTALLTAQNTKRRIVTQDWLSMPIKWPRINLLIMPDQSRQRITKLQSPWPV